MDLGLGSQYLNIYIKSFYIKIYTYYIKMECVKSQFIVKKQSL